jgi:hypothetical protein
VKKKRLGVEGGADGWVPPVSRKKKARGKGGGSGVLLGWLLLGPGVGPVAGSSLFFCSETFSNFCFFYSLYLLQTLFKPGQTNL